MKKTLMILCAVALALVSCNTDFTPVEENDPVQVVFKLSAIHPDGAATKAVKTGWESGDVIFVFFSGQTAPAHLEMKWTGSSWENETKGNLSLRDDETGTMTAVYLPFGSGATVMAEEGTYQFSETFYSYYLTDQQTYTVTNGEVSGTFKMKVPDGYLQFFLDDADAEASTSIELREPKLTPQGIASISADGTITHTTVAHGAPLPGYVYDKEIKASGENKGWLFCGILASEARNEEKDYNFTLVKGGWNGQYYGKSFLSKTFYRGASEGRALKIPDLSAWTVITDYKPIDLGCDVDGKRIYWSSRNLEATEDSGYNSGYGRWYAWGETIQKGGGVEGVSRLGTWENYKWMQEGQSDWKHITKYTVNDGKIDGIWYNGDSFNGDNKSVLDLEDDAAHAILGGNWRIPTKQELNFLNSSCKWESIIKLTPNEESAYYDGRYINLPFQCGSIENPNDHAFGYYWSSSLYEEDSSHAYLLVIANKSDHAITHKIRCEAYAIRPVSE